MTRRLVLARHYLDGKGVEWPAFQVALAAPLAENAVMLEEALSLLVAAREPAERLGPYLAALLLEAPFRLPFVDPLRDLPVEAGRQLLPFLARGPDVLRQPGDADAWAAYAESVLAACGAAALPFLRLHAAFAATGDLRRLITLRGRLIAQTEGVDDWQPGRPAAGQLIRLGLLTGRIDDRPNTRFLLPHIDRLDRRRYRVFGYALGGGEDGMAALFRSACDRLVRLDSMAQHDRVAAIRRDRLDILLIGGNVAASVDPLCRLAAWRLARHQILLAATPVTSGLASIDHVLVGTETPPGAAAQYTEELLQLDRLFCCFDPGLRRAAVAAPGRADFGIEESAKLLLSTASLTKLTPACLDLWLSILETRADAVLLLAPFNPYWLGDTPPRAALAAHLADLARRRGIAPYRIRLAGPFADAGSVDALVGLADLYLDAFPYAGCTTLLAPLAAGVPVVAMAGDSQRGNQAAALLAAAGRQGGIARDAGEYRRIALDMLGLPRLPEPSGGFLDAADFARSLDAALSSMLAANAAGEDHGDHAR
ncbi:hypothetical protein [Falsiroseomonas sp.]|uniref:O-linked N-acetylglucosamine transferase family protein n=1 Tax=Falsiroseomonas sp. TaxID=2870721 RepID=UPI00271FE2C7|nr:hypothetical protein [Falsiroseomonas sp.]MDO9500426.1 hypothetical protein [Falsiroseomonas sp.]